LSRESNLSLAPPVEVKTVLLDAGGVLLDLDYPYIRRLLVARSLDATPEKLSRGEALARKEIQKRVSDGGRSVEAWRDYFRILLGEAKVSAGLREEIIDTLWEANQRVGLWTVPVAGAREAVTRMRDVGYRIGVVSNAEGHVERDLVSAGFIDLFETVVDSHLVGVEKPDPEIFRIALKRLDASPETSVFLGDVPAVDIQGARAAGITPVLLDRFDLYPEIDAKRIRSIRELLDWLSSREAAT
jgi:putative hydrolase of the HAD superfamily